MDVESRLREIDFLKHLPPEQFKALASICQLQKHVAGEEILLQGEMTDHFFIVDEGYVNFAQTDREGFEKPVGSRGPGEYFGVKMFTTQEPSEYTAQAVGAATLYVISRENFDQLLEKDPGLLDALPQLRKEKEQLTGGFTWLATGEIVVLKAHKHWWAFVLDLRLPGVMLALLGVAIILVNLLNFLKPYPQIGYALAALLVAPLLWGIVVYFEWSNDLYIVTNKRVIRIDQVLFTSYSRSEIPLEKIQSVNVMGGGPIARLLGVWTLQVFSAAAKGEGLIFEQVGQVEAIQAAIARQQVAFLARARAADREKYRRFITREIRHHVLRQGSEEVKPRPAARAPANIRTRFQSFWNNLFGFEFREGNLITWRKHPVILLAQTGPFLAATLVLIAVTILLSRLGVPQLLSPAGFYAIMGFLIVTAFVLVIWQWEDWRNDLYQVTDNEIVDIESLPFRLNYHAKHAPISNLQDVTAARPRFINTLLDFGNVNAKVAGDAAPFTFDNVAHPSDVAAEIFRRIQAIKLRQRERETGLQSRQIVDALIAYHRLLMAERHQAGSANVPSLPPSSAIPSAANSPSAANPSVGNSPPTANSPAASALEPVIAKEQEESPRDDGREFPPEDEYRNPWL